MKTVPTGFPYSSPPGPANPVTDTATSAFRSAINYVDLLKKEELQDEKVKEYIEILDKKSQRLKKLTEDLVEASKVSSGNVKLNIEEIKLKELIYQCYPEELSYFYYIPYLLLHILLQFSAEFS